MDSDASKAKRDRVYLRILAVDSLCATYGRVSHESRLEPESPEWGAGNQPVKTHRRMVPSAQHFNSPARAVFLEVFLEDHHHTVTQRISTQCLC